MVFRFNNPTDPEPVPLGISYARVWGLTMTSTVPPGRGPLCITTQALRAWLLSACPGTKAIRPSERLALS
jgi:hypothetical protein